MITGARARMRADMYRLSEPRKEEECDLIWKNLPFDIQTASCEICTSIQCRISVPGLTSSIVFNSSQTWCLASCEAHGEFRTTKRARGRLLILPNFRATPTPHPVVIHGAKTGGFPIVLGATYDIRYLLLHPDSASPLLVRVASTTTCSAGLLPIAHIPRRFLEPPLSPLAQFLHTFPVAKMGLIMSRLVHDRCIHLRSWEVPVSILRRSTASRPIVLSFSWHFPHASLSLPFTGAYL